MSRSLALAALCSLFLSPPTGAQASTTNLDTVLSSHDWLNGHVSESDVRGKVVLVDFYTFECINCQHVEPNLRKLYRDTRRDDLVVISVHSPETPFERDRSNLKASIASQGIAWPVVVDNGFAVWNAYGVSAWPTQLIFDRHGELVKTIVGEGQDDDVNSTVRELIAQK
ncbi:MAG TPA: redoxin domain-containing protein [Candidatus Eremiobacteraceae bacterium]|nr:redoxin domain-containing protein [Candidatus Eremiobacteraceae bacterium]